MEAKVGDCMVVTLGTSCWEVTAHHYHLLCHPSVYFWTHFFTFTTMKRDFHSRKMLPHVLSTAALLLFVLIRDTYEEVTRVLELMSNN